MQRSQGKYRKTLSQRRMRGLSNAASSPSPLLLWPSWWELHLQKLSRSCSGEPGLEAAKEMPWYCKKLLRGDGSSCQRVHRARPPTRIRLGSITCGLLTDARSRSATAARALLHGSRCPATAGESLRCRAATAGHRCSSGSEAAAAAGLQQLLGIMMCPVGGLHHGEQQKRKAQDAASADLQQVTCAGGGCLSRGRARGEGGQPQKGGNVRLVWAGRGEHRSASNAAIAA